MPSYNTGRKIYTTLVQVYEDTLEPTGFTKPNLPSDPDYIAPIVDLTKCPLDPSVPPEFSSNLNEIIFITNESSKVIPWTDARKAKFGLFPVIDIWVLQEGGSYAKSLVAYTTNFPPPDTTLINLDFGEVINGFLIIS